MLCLVNWSGPDYHISFTIKYRLNNSCYIISAILIIRISINNDICTISKTSVKACHKALCKTFILLKINCTAFVYDGDIL